MSYTQDTESADRRAYREKCKYRSEYEDFCFLRSHHGPCGGVTMGCTASANCPRMKRYDKQKIKEMKAILFSERYGLRSAVIAGRKTMTRRVSEKQRYQVGEIVAIAQPYCELGKTTFRWKPGWLNPMFISPTLMPHRIRIINVRAEHLQDISDEDCLREGIYKQDPRPGVPALYAFETCKDQYGDTLAKRWYVSPREAFAELIDKVSGKGTWQANPFVYVYEFEKVR